MTKQMMIKTRAPNLLIKRSRRCLHHRQVLLTRSLSRKQLLLRRCKKQALRLSLHLLRITKAESQMTSGRNRMMNLRMMMLNNRLHPKRLLSLLKHQPKHRPAIFKLLQRRLRKQLKALLSLSSHS